MDDLSRVDPDLVQKLQTSSGDEPVRAAVSIRRPSGVKPDPDEITTSAHAAIARAADNADVQPNSIQVMPHLALAYVEAPGRLIRELIAQPEVTGAMLGGDTAPEQGSA